MQSQVCEKVSGCCFMIRMDFLQEIGFFDEYPFLYCEEAILAVQVKQHDKKMFYIADTQAVHRHVKKVKGNSIALLKHYRKSRIYFHKQYVKDNFLGYAFFYLMFHCWFGAMLFVKKIRAFNYGHEQE
jgi:GT2 family glycosyltransferase